MIELEARISAVLITYNDAERIRPCLESISWVDEIVIVDLGSADETVSICHEFTERVHHHDWVPYADPIRDEAIGLVQGEWVLMLDADERVSQALSEELRSIAERGNADVVLIPYWFMSFGYRRYDSLARLDAIPRFFRKGALRWPPEVHARPDLRGLRQIRLDPARDQYILHDGWRTTAEVLDKIGRYTVLEAEMLHSRDVRFSVTSLLRDVSREVGRGFVYGAYRDGAVGVFGVGFSAFYRFCVWARLWEMQGRTRREDRRVARWGRVLGFGPRLAFQAYKLLRRG